jgi:hypothetical protein
VGSWLGVLKGGKTMSDPKRRWVPRILELANRIAYAEPGSGMVATGLPTLIGALFERLGVDWYDEWAACHDCGAIVRTRVVLCRGCAVFAHIVDDE